MVGNCMAMDRRANEYDVYIMEISALKAVDSSGDRTLDA